MIGTLSILNVGAGDTKLSFDKKKPEEVRHARTVIQDMLKRGFAILVQVGTRKGEPLYQRARKFDPKTDEYIIVGIPEDGEEQAPKKGRKTAARPRLKEQRLKADKTRAVAVGRSAGG